MRAPSCLAALKTLSHIFMIFLYLPAYYSSYQVTYYVLLYIQAPNLIFTTDQISLAMDDEWTTVRGSGKHKKAATRQGMRLTQNEP